MNKKPINSKHIHVFYNSACPVCDAGVKYQQHRMRGCPVEWNDVNIDQESVQQLYSSLEFVRERLHVKNTAGNVLIGIDAFIALWELSPGEEWKARLVKKPVIHSIAKFAYNAFAWLLYRWNLLRGNW